MWLRHMSEPKAATNSFVPAGATCSKLPSNILEPSGGVAKIMCKLLMMAWLTMHSLLPDPFIQMKAHIHQAPCQVFMNPVKCNRDPYPNLKV